jgi:hypothetical protein
MALMTNDLPLSNIIIEMRALHHDVERIFLSFNRIVPYKDNKFEVYSPRLYPIFQSASAQVISMMDAITRFLMLEPAAADSSSHNNRQKKFPYYYKLLNIHGMLSMQMVALREKVETNFAPFLALDDIPEWWQRYNDTKHDLPEGAYAANLGNVIYALGALAVIHDIGELALRGHTASKILDINNWRDRSSEFQSDYDRLKNTNMSSGVLHTANRGFFSHKSRIFYYLNEFRPI